MSDIDNHHRGAIHMAVEGDIANILSILLEHGADPDIMDENGNSGTYTRTHTIFGVIGGVMSRLITYPCSCLSEKGCLSVCVLCMCVTYLPCRRMFWRG